MVELPRLLQKISKENEKRIQKAVLNNQKRIELLSKNTDENVEEIILIGDGQDVVDCIHKRNKKFIRDNQTIKLQSAQDYERLKIANAKGLNDFLSLAL
ncbi:hypothetical protein TNIN_147341 [Trichonephila inaurata madagascariensis]|uniref:Uncharacterized protein n=1 Tax=Trichonephila inaurata madagascariensis TaxID=2747483 RepID=A0A8X6YUY7_9ARAC|nr:hypothetical protein TNIN_147341 [Trichonephila inaurata madagascariensis]